MRVVFTFHAKRRMAKRKVTPEQVQEVLDWPDDVLPGEESEEIAIKRYGTREIRVVYENTGRDVIVIYTVISKPLRRASHES